MSLSIFDLFKVGIGPSSSHTVGPMWAVRRFIDSLNSSQVFDQVARIETRLYGSLALTGKGHCTDKAVILGLLGYCPDTLDPAEGEAALLRLKDEAKICLDAKHEIAFEAEGDILFFFEQTLPQHPNGMTLCAYDKQGRELLTRTYFSVGGGFVVDEDEFGLEIVKFESLQPYPFRSMEELLKLCSEQHLSIYQLVLANEEAIDGDLQLVRNKLNRIWQVMENSIDRGCKAQGLLPGSLGLPRRAYQLKQELLSKPEAALRDPLAAMDWVSLYALAVNEENAAGGQVVTAPTNGAAGVIPAVLAYYKRFMHGADEDGLHLFLVTAAAIGMLYKYNASISAAEVGCQGEIGVACSMAAGALCAVMGGSNEQIENAAEIGMEHNLGMTCDPIGGLVQVPCIERNTMGAIKAINAARLAIRGDGRHSVSLDSVIETMHQTGLDMQSKYKETSQGGLAVNVVEC